MFGANAASCKQASETALQSPMETSESTARPAYQRALAAHLGDLRPER
jgi:hypothetical protein